MRLIRPEDKEHLDPSRLSQASQIQRFWTAKPRLTGRELSYLTEVDELDHLALVCFERRPEEVGLGVARFIRLKGSDCAEVAVTVADDAQGRGLGTLMFRELLLAARERGVVCIQAWVMADNTPALRMVRRGLPGAEELNEGSIVHFTGCI